MHSCTHPLHTLVYTCACCPPRFTYMLVFTAVSRNFTRLNTTIARRMSALPKNNPYFNLSGKDIWTLINETAAQKEAESGEKVANLGQGFFSYAPPNFAVEAARKAFLSPMDNQYAAPQGKPQLINALQTHYSEKLGYPLAKEQITITTGANEGMLATFFGFLEKGDEVIVFQPFFDQYISNIEMAQGKVIYAKLTPPKDFAERTVDADEYTIDWDELEKLITDKTKMMIINTPHNPIGKIFSYEELERLGNLAVKHNFIILSDEVYENLYFGKEFPRIAKIENGEIRRRVLCVGSAGKSFAATGWRIGWIIGSKELVPYVKAAHTRICFSSPAPLQVAVAESIEVADKNNYFEEMRKQYKNKYAILESFFDEINIPYTKADGGYFLLVNFAKVKMPELEWPDLIKDKPRDFKLAYWLIQEFGVVTIPPTEFYLEGEYHDMQDCIRFAVCKDDAILQDAVERLRLLKNFL